MGVSLRHRGSAGGGPIAFQVMSSSVVPALTWKVGGVDAVAFAVVVGGRGHEEGGGRS